QMRAGEASPAAEDKASSLARAMAGKVNQRVREGLTGYHERPDSCVQRTVGDRPALHCLAEFTQDGKAMIEYLTWIEGDRASGLFFARTPAADLEAYGRRLEPIVESVRLP